MALLVVNSQLSDVNTKFTDVNMRSCKSATTPAIRPLVEETIRSREHIIITASKPTVVSALGPLHMSRVTGLAQLPRRILLSVHVGNFSPVDRDEIQETQP